MCRSQECAIYNVFVYTGTIYSLPGERDRDMYGDDCDAMSSRDIIIVHISFRLLYILS